MPEFICSVCGEKFAVPEQALERYPNWQPKYCRKHSPQRGAGDQKSAKQRPKRSATGELDLSVAEVLRRFDAGPDTGVFTDGSSRPNPGPGGWGVVKVADGQILEQRHGSDPDTTNNRMELTALITGLQLIPTDAACQLYTDSELCVNILTKWAAGWKQRGWKRKGGPIKNLDLVQAAYALFQERPLVEIKWIEAHNGWRWNEYADSLATAWARQEL